MITLAELRKLPTCTNEDCLHALIGPHRHARTYTYTEDFIANVGVPETFQFPD